MMEYILLALMAWVLGFIPYFEIYLAVPATLALGLDPVSSVVWAGLGNFFAVPVILFMREKLSHIPKIKRWLDKFTYSKYQETVNRMGYLFIIIFTPLAGIWVAAALASTLGYNNKGLMITSALSVAIYGSLTAVATLAGFEFIGL